MLFSYCSFDAKGPRAQNGKGEDSQSRCPQRVASNFQIRLAFETNHCRRDGEFVPSVFVDYGFVNCRTEEERLELREMYRRIFDHYQADPVQLHEAAMSGRL